MKVDHFKKATFHREKAMEHLKLFLDHMQKYTEPKKPVESKPAKRTYNRKT